MADITKCSGKNCKLKKTCYRYVVPSGMWQSYFAKPPIKDGKCDAYWEIKFDCSKYNKREGQSCDLNNLCKYPNCSKYAPDKV